MTNAPSRKILTGQDWADDRVIMFGGEDEFGTKLDTGFTYNPVSDTWLPITTTNAPAARSGL